MALKAPLAFDSRTWKFDGVRRATMLVAELHRTADESGAVKPVTLPIQFVGNLMRLADGSYRPQRDIRREDNGKFEVMVSLQHTGYTSTSQTRIPFRAAHAALPALPPLCHIQQRSMIVPESCDRSHMIQIKDLSVSPAAALPWQVNVEGVCAAHKRRSLDSDECVCAAGTQPATEGDGCLQCPAGNVKPNASNEACISCIDYTRTLHASGVLLTPFGQPHCAASARLLLLRLFASQPPMPDCDVLVLCRMNAGNVPASDDLRSFSQPGARHISDCGCRSGALLVFDGFNASSFSKICPAPDSRWSRFYPRVGVDSDIGRDLRHESGCCNSPSEGRTQGWPFDQWCTSYAERQCIADYCRWRQYERAALFSRNPVWYRDEVIEQRVHGYRFESSFNRSDPNHPVEPLFSHCSICPGAHL